MDATVTSAKRRRGTVEWSDRHADSVLQEKARSMEIAAGVELDRSDLVPTPEPRAQHRL